MTFPSVADFNTSTEPVATATHGVDMPPTVNAGEVLLIKISTGGEPVIVMPTGWQNAYPPVVFVAVSLATFMIIADGTEGGTTVNFTTVDSAGDPLSVKSSHISCAITDWIGDLRGIRAGDAQTANTTTPNPPSVTATSGTGDNLFIALMSMQRTLAITGFPTGYTDNQTEVSTGDGGQDSIVVMATQEIAAASDNPDTFSAAIQRRSVAQTLVIPPLGATIPILYEGLTQELTQEITREIIG
jgi:hypothetical protein